ncbi:MAG: alpha/beta fold hydrolase [Acidobacteria bacterium]|nr:alpha/beta fold hydrolase [Acidobacteriota bacterium]MBV9435662.1 alpha/beta fold hydrolase [Acidobacteriota bacterium]
MFEAFNYPGEPAVRGFLHRAEREADGLVLAHSAGSNCHSPLLVALAEAFRVEGVTVLRCDLPFRQARPHGPPFGSSAMDQAGLRQAIEALRAEVSGRIFLGGHSYGGRMASMLAAESARVADALLLLSYPLHPPRKPQQLRTAHFSGLRTPVFFVHGTRDPLGSISEMESALKLISANTQLFPLENAGHELLGKTNRELTVSAIVKSFIHWSGTLENSA